MREYEDHLLGEALQQFDNWPSVKAARSMAADYHRACARIDSLRAERDAARQEREALRKELDAAKALNNGFKATVDRLNKKLSGEIDRNASLTEQRNNLTALLSFIRTGLGGDPNNYDWRPDSIHADADGRVVVTVSGFRRRGGPVEPGDPDDDALYDDGPRDEEVRRQLDAVIDEINQTFPGFRARVHDRLEQ